MPAPESSLSRRERQIMDVIYERGRASVAEVLEVLPDPPSYSAVRTLMGILKEKGHLNTTKDGNRYIYSPRRARSRAGKSALHRVVNTFYEGSLTGAVAGLLEGSDTKLSDEEFDRLSKLIEEARKERRDG